MFVLFMHQLLSWCGLFVFYATLLYTLGIGMVFLDCVRQGKRFGIQRPMLVVLFFSLVYLFTSVTWFFAHG